MRVNPFRESSTNIREHPRTAADAAFRASAYDMRTLKADSEDVTSAKRRRDSEVEFLGIGGDGMQAGSSDARMAFKCR
jgi:hypothetical protein